MALAALCRLRVRSSIRSTPSLVMARAASLPSATIFAAQPSTISVAISSTARRTCPGSSVRPAAVSGPTPARLTTDRRRVSCREGRHSGISDVSFFAYRSHTWPMNLFERCFSLSWGDFDDEKLEQVKARPDALCLYAGRRGFRHSLLDVRAQFPASARSERDYAISRQRRAGLQQR